jgi:hypothetical protein
MEDYRTLFNQTPDGMVYYKHQPIGHYSGDMDYLIASLFSDTPIRAFNASTFKMLKRHEEGKHYNLRGSKITKDEADLINKNGHVLRELLGVTEETEEEELPEI